MSFRYSILVFFPSLLKPHNVLSFITKWGHSKVFLYTYLNTYLTTNFLYSYLPAWRGPDTLFCKLICVAIFSWHTCPSYEMTIAIKVINLVSPWWSIIALIMVSIASICFVISMCNYFNLFILIYCAILLLKLV